MGPPPDEDERDLDLMNAGKKYVTALPGAAYFHHADSFAMIRGGHLDVCVLGGYQVAANGDVANWSTGKPGAIPAVGGAMDLAAGARDVRLIMAHTTRDGEPRLVGQCTYPLTARGRASRVYTDLAVIDSSPSGFVVREMVEGLSKDELAAKTGAPIEIASDCKSLTAPDF